MENICTLEEKISVRKFVLRVLASGILMMALDLFLNAGVFAKVWLEPSPFLLDPQQLFRRIPLGYIAFFLEAGVYVWLTMRIGAKTWKQGHEFIRRGPYRFVRHPIYTGLLTMCLGTATEIGRLHSWLALPLMMAALWIKLKQEEAFMLQHFPDEYPAYQKQVKALVPFVI
jgi:protein-S-isoprenylcysteine O-methyltransferase Ste14